MEFFNRLEEVIEFKLTQHGRRKLANGTFNPSFYSFSDSDILYDSKYAGFTGTQNECTEMVTGSVRPRNATFLSPVLDNAKVFKNNILAPCVIGTSKHGADKFPAFQIKLYNGNFTGSSHFITSSAYLGDKIPVLNVNVDCLFNTTTKEFDSHKYILLEIEELNGLFEKENFEYQILRRKNTTGNFQTAAINFEIPLEFFNEKNSDNFFSGNIDSQFFEVNELKENVLNYWFETYVDEQIPEIITFNKDNSNIYLDPRNNITANC